MKRIILFIPSIIMAAIFVFYVDMALRYCADKAANKAMEKIISSCEETNHFEYGSAYFQCEGQE